jgi:hypothetical protein
MNEKEHAPVKNSYPIKITHIPQNDADYSQTETTMPYGKIITTKYPNGDVREDTHLIECHGFSTNYYKKIDDNNFNIKYKDFTKYNEK